MEANEPIMFARVEPGGGTETACDHSTPKTGWRCVLQGKTDGHLTINIMRDRHITRPKWPAPGGTNCLADVDRSKRHWPHEAHHLIPWQQLKKHPVRQFLKEGSKLLADANYSVNHGNNGKFMPFASDLQDWKGSAKAKATVAFALMDKVKLQLHQSRHSFQSFDGGVTTGYKSRVKELLDTVRRTEVRHRDSCKECANKADDGKLPPRRQMTRKIDGVSSKLEGDIKGGRIFVSRRAHAWYFARKAAS